MAEYPTKGDLPYGAKLKTYIDTAVATIGGVPASLLTRLGAVEAEVDGLQATSEAFDSLTGRPDGAIDAATYTTLSNHPITLFSDGGNYTISGGALVHPITTVQTAAYLGVQVGKPVRSFSFEAKWTDAGAGSDELAVMVVSGERFYKPGTTYPNAGAHVLLGRSTWTYQKYQAGVGAIAKANASYTALAYGVWHKFRLTFDGALATLWFPNGTSYTVAADADIVAWWGNHATVESFSTGTKNPVAIRAWQVDTSVDIVPDPAASSTVAKARYVKAPASVTTTLDATFKTIATASVTVPPSKALGVIAQQYIEHAGDGNMIAQIDVGGNTTSRTIMQVLQTQAFKGAITLVGVLDLSEFTVGTAQTVNVKLYATGTATAQVADGTHRRQPIIVHEVAGTFV